MDHCIICNKPRDANQRFAHTDSEGYEQRCPQLELPSDWDRSRYISLKELSNG